VDDRRDKEAQVLEQFKREGWEHAATIDAVPEEGPEFGNFDAFARTLFEVPKSEIDQKRKEEEEGGDGPSVA
jgi:hypothetical protein